MYSPCDLRITCGARGTVEEGVTPEISGNQWVTPETL